MLLGRPCAARAGAAFVVEVVSPRVGVAQTVVGSEEIRRPVVGRVVDQRSGACRESTIHDQRNRLLFNLPIRPFWTVHVDVACTAVAKRSSSALGRIQFGFSLQQGAIPLNHLGNGNLAWVVEACWLPVFQNDLIALHQAQGQATPLLHAQVVERPLEFRAVGVVHEQFPAFGNLEFLEVKAQAGRPSPFTPKRQTRRPSSSDQLPELFRLKSTSCSMPNRQARPSWSQSLCPPPQAWQGRGLQTSPIPRF